MSETDELLKIGLHNRERIIAIEKTQALDHERISVLERQAQNMAALPTTVALMGAEVKSIKESMLREVDGLREQSKAHKADIKHDMDAARGDIKKDMDSAIDVISQKIDAREVRQRGWWDVIELLGKLVIGAAVIAETLKLFH